ncbi:MAG: DUF2752 domain-containing protein [Planctomycetota bacterium]|nr:MAG: DUF2752 domain-containing protein [Planctomycetota bacterium]
MLTVGAALTPSPAGHGTHTQLGLPPCSWALALGRPCPTCGMTTAVSLAAHGDLASALHAQPMGLAIALAASSLFWIALHSALTGSLLWSWTLSLLLRPSVLAGAAAGGLLAWGHTILAWSA